MFFFWCFWLLFTWSLNWVLHLSALIPLWFQMKTAADACVLYDIDKKHKKWCFFHDENPLPLSPRTKWCAQSLIWIAIDGNWAWIVQFSTFVMKEIENAELKNLPFHVAKRFCCTKLSVFFFFFFSHFFLQ